MARCIVETAEGTPCGREATFLDRRREGPICPECYKEDLIAEITRVREQNPDDIRYLNDVEGALAMMDVRYVRLKPKTRRK